MTVKAKYPLPRGKDKKLRTCFQMHAYCFCGEISPVSSPELDRMWEKPLRNHPNVFSLTYDTRKIKKIKKEKEKSRKQRQVRPHAMLSNNLTGMEQTANTIQGLEKSLESFKKAISAIY